MRSLMTKTTIIGFDSAWADKAPGAICALTVEQGSVTGFHYPESVKFDQAADYVVHRSRGSSYSLVALDQPTLVPNAFGMRPVERVAGSLVNQIKGGVQPANQSKHDLFGEHAPVWRFLDRLGARENPLAAKEASSGLFLMEVFPALSLPSIVPAIWKRRRAAKYNPGNGKTYSHDDWKLVTLGLADFANGLNAEPIAKAALEMAQLSKPHKADQDKLDSLICLTIGLAWRVGRPDQSMVIGDGRSGYMVTPVSQETRSVLAAAAAKVDVPVDATWPDDAKRTVLDRSETTPIATPGAPSIKAPDLHKTALLPGSAKTCPECGHEFKGTGWGGIDAHWKAKHEDIMHYHLAWPIIKAGNKPSDDS
jgi:predicted RNase H-like nuclease